MGTPTQSLHIKAVNSNSDLPFDYLCVMSECLRVIAHPRRLQIILKIIQGDFTVDEISQHLGLSHAQTCGHLRLMESKQLLRRERRGRNVYYSIAEPRLVDFMDCIQSKYTESNNY